MLRRWFLAAAVIALISGCDESTAPRDVHPPAAPRGLRSVTGDGEARLSWLANTESDVAGYRVYMSPCANGPDCPFDRIGTTGATDFIAPLANGVTRFFAVAAFDRAGNESALTFEDVFDTPRPAGTGLVLTDYVAAPALSGYDFSAFSVVPFDNPNVDVFFGVDGATYRMYAPFTDTDLQDAGFTWSLDDIDFAPLSGWSRDGTVELIEGHSSVVRTASGLASHYAKFRVVALSASPAQVVLDWAYQIDPDNQELRAGTGKQEGGRTPARVRRAVVVEGSS
jgi:hypothetical protein